MTGIGTEVTSESVFVIVIVGLVALTAVIAAAVHVSRNPRRFERLLSKR